MDWRVGDFVDIALREDYKAIAFTANSCVNKDGGLVMGLGAAKRIKDFYNGIDVELGKKIKKASSYVQPDYHVVAVQLPSIWILAVQTKRHFQDHNDSVSKQSCWDLTAKSLELLALTSLKYPERNIILNCPLINNGGYADQAEDVYNLVEEKLQGTNITVTTLKPR